MKIVAGISEKVRHFFWIVCWADDSHGMSSLIFSENNDNKEYFIMPSAVVVIDNIKSNTNFMVAACEERNTTPVK